MSYVVGDEGITGASYRFPSGEAICNYVQTTIILDKPDFLVHNEATGDFTLAQTEDFSIVDSYKVRIISYIESPEGLTQRAETSFLVEVIHPCTRSVIQDWTMEPSLVTVRIGEVPQTVMLPDVKDSVSLQYGDQTGLTFCGPKSFQFLNDASEYEHVASYDGDKTMTFETNDPTLKDQFIFILLAPYLVDYASEAGYLDQRFFSIMVMDC